MKKIKNRYIILIIASLVNFVHGNPYIWTVFQPYVRKEYNLSLAASSQPFTIIIGIFAGICNLVPYFGPIVAYVGTISFGLLYGQNTKVIIAVIALIIVQQIDGSIIGPKLLGDNVSLKPVFILVSVIIGSSLFGIVGMILAVPVAAMIKLMVKKFIDNRLKAKGIVFNQKGEIVKGKNKR